MRSMATLAQYKSHYQKVLKFWQAWDKDKANTERSESLSVPASAFEALSGVLRLYESSCAAQVGNFENADLRQFAEDVGRQLMDKRSAPDTGAAAGTPLQCSGDRFKPLLTQAALAIQNNVPLAPAPAANPSLGASSAKEGRTGAKPSSQQLLEQNPVSSPAVDADSIPASALAGESAIERTSQTGSKAAAETASPVSQQADKMVEDKVKEVQEQPEEADAKPDAQPEDMEVTENAETIVEAQAPIEEETPRDQPKYGDMDVGEPSVDAGDVITPAASPQPTPEKMVSNEAQPLSLDGAVQSASSKVADVSTAIGADVMSDAVHTEPSAPVAAEVAPVQSTASPSVSLVDLDSAEGSMSEEAKRKQEKEKAARELEVVLARRQKLLTEDEALRIEAKEAESSYNSWLALCEAHAAQSGGLSAELSAERRAQTHAAEVEAAEMQRLRARCASMDRCIQWEEEQRSADRNAFGKLRAVYRDAVAMHGSLKKEFDLVTQQDRAELAAQHEKMKGALLELGATQQELHSAQASAKQGIEEREAVLAMLDKPGLAVTTSTLQALCRAARGETARLTHERRVASRRAQRLESQLSALVETARRDQSWAAAAPGVAAQIDAARSRLVELQAALLSSAPRVDDGPAEGSSAALAGPLPAALRKAAGQRVAELEKSGTGTRERLHSLQDDLDAGTAKRALRLRALVGGEGGGDSEQNIVQELSRAIETLGGEIASRPDVASDDAQQRAGQAKSAELAKKQNLLLRLEAAKLRKKLDEEEKRKQKLLECIEQERRERKLAEDRLTSEAEERRELERRLRDASVAAAASATDAPTKAPTAAGSKCPVAMFLEAEKKRRKAVARSSELARLKAEVFVQRELLSEVRSSQSFASDPAAKFDPSWKRVAQDMLEHTQQKEIALLRKELEEVSSEQDLTTPGELEGDSAALTRKRQRPLDVGLRTPALTQDPAALRLSYAQQLAAVASVGGEEISLFEQAWRNEVKRLEQVKKETMERGQTLAKAALDEGDGRRRMWTICETLRERSDLLARSHLQEDEDRSRLAELRVQLEAAESERSAERLQARRFKEEQGSYLSEVERANAEFAVLNRQREAVRRCEQECNQAARRLPNREQQAMLREEELQSEQAAVRAQEADSEQMQAEHDDLYRKHEARISELTQSLSRIKMEKEEFGRQRLQLEEQRLKEEESTLRARFDDAAQQVELHRELERCWKSEENAARIEREKRERYINKRKDKFQVQPAAAAASSSSSTAPAAAGGGSAKRPLSPEDAAASAAGAKAARTEGSAEPSSAPVRTEREEIPGESPVPAAKVARVELQRERPDQIAASDEAALDERASEVAEAPAAEAEDIGSARSSLGNVVQAQGQEQDQERERAQCQDQEQPQRFDDDAHANAPEDAEALHFQEQEQVFRCEREQEQEQDQAPIFGSDAQLEAPGGQEIEHEPALQFQEEEELRPEQSSELEPWSSHAPLGEAAGSLGEASGVVADVSTGSAPAGYAQDDARAAASEFQGVREEEEDDDGSGVVDVSSAPPV